MRKLTPAVARERRRCARIAADSEEAYRVLAAKAHYDEEHRRQCLARQWCAEAIRRDIERGRRP